MGTPEAATASATASAAASAAASAGTEPDPVARTIELVGDRWTMLILRAVFRGLRRFEDLRLDLGIARPVLSDRLRKLVDTGLLVKTPYQDRPLRHEYRLSPMGIDLSPALVALMRWGDRWLADDRPSTVLYHAPCGTELEQAFWCRSCAATFGPLAIRSRSTGPVAHPDRDAHPDRGASPGRRRTRG